MTQVTEETTHNICDDHGCFRCFPNLADIECADPDCNPYFWRACIEEEDQSEEPFRVNEYLIDLSFGGTEEGGWYYETRRFIRCLGTAPTRDLAQLIHEQHISTVNEANKELPQLWSVTSRGRTFLHIERFDGADFPSRPPIYS